MADGTAQVSIENEFGWNADRDGLIKAIGDLGPNLLGADARFYGQITEPGEVVTQYSFTTLDDWSRSFQGSAGRSWLTLTAKDNSNSLNISAEQANQKLRVGVRVPITSTEDAKGWIAKLRTQLNLIPVSPQRSGSSSVNCSRSYVLPQHASADALLNGIAQLQDWLGSDRFGASFRLSKEPEYTYRPATAGEWKQVLSTHWGELLDAQCSFGKDNLFLMLNFSFSNLSAGVTLTSESRERINDAMTRVTAALELSVPFRVASTQDRGSESGHYFIPQPTPPDWVVKALSALSREGTQVTNFNGSITLQSEPTITRGYTNLERWREDVVAKEKDLRRIQCGIYSATDGVSFDYDTRRADVRVSYQNKDASLAATKLKQVAAELGLKPAESYQDALYTRVYQMTEKWSPRLFADDVPNAVQIAFPDRYGAVRAFVTEGGGDQARYPFSDFQTFTEAANKPGADYRELRVEVDGPEGKTLTVSARPREKQLTVQSNLASTTLFVKVAESFRGVEFLKNEKPVLPQERKPQDKQDSGKEQVWLKILLIVIPAALAVVFGGLTAKDIYVESKPKYSLELRHPVLHDGKPPRLSSASTYIEWATTRHQYWRDSRVPSMPAQIRVFGQDDKPIRTFECETSGCTIALTLPESAKPLPPGLYQIEVQGTPDEVRKSVTVEIAQQPAARRSTGSN